MFFFVINTYGINLQNLKSIIMRLNYACNVCIKCCLFFTAKDFVSVSKMKLRLCVFTGELQPHVKINKAQLRPTQNSASNN
jgi:hypothetical protein